jgi:exopolyphosphatase/guanosine-5'-triphosphate,3'-diphosphate pyrophosphatase
MQKGIAAVAELAAEARRLGAERIVAVATSAVRDAANGGEFRAGVQAAAGIEVRILGGIDEANLIGLGLTTDPALAGLRDFFLFDLGGGSLECLSFRDRKVERAASLPLGCVRLTERFVPDASLPFGDSSHRAIREHVKNALIQSGLTWPLPGATVVAGTGGTLTTVRAIVAAERGVPLLQADARLDIPLLHGLLARLAPLDLAARQKIAGLPAPRADVFPAALAILLAAADVGGFLAYQHSVRNLRWGVAAELLQD